MNTTVSGSLKKGLISIAPLYVALMGVFFVPTVFAVEYDITCTYTDYPDTLRCGRKNTYTGGSNFVMVGLSNTTVGGPSDMTLVGVGNTMYGGTGGAVVGTKNMAMGESVAFGRENNAYSTNPETGAGPNGALSSAFGIKNKSFGEHSSAFGYGNTASGNNASSFGVNNEVTSSDASAFGVNNKVTTAYSSALGYQNTASAAQTTAIGVENTANAMHATAMGRGNTASGGWTSAIGQNNTASENGAVAVGYGNTAQQANSVAVGVENVANNGTTTAVGFQNKANGLESSALGYGNITNDNYEVAVGYKNITNGARSTAVGNENQATALWSSAVGGENIAGGAYSSAVGFNNNVSGGYASAFGAFNSATADYSIALGSSSNAYRAAGDVGYSPVGKTYDTDTTGVWKSNRGVVAVGDSKNENAAITRQITGVAAGKYDTDAVNVAQLKEVAGMVGSGGTSPCSYDANGNLSCGKNENDGVNASTKNATVLGTSNNQSVSGNTIVGNGAVVVGYNNNYSYSEDIAVGAHSTAVGYNNIASGNYSSAVGFNNTASDNSSSAVGNRNTASNSGSSAVGYRNKASANSSSAVGHWNTASGNWSSAVGYENLASGRHSSAMGFSNTASGSDSSAVGNKNTANKLYSSALGAYNTAEVDFGTAVGFGSLANRDQGTKGVYAPANLDSLDAKGKAAWQATSAALAVGNPDNTNLEYYDPNTKTTVSITTPITRQITGVAAGSQDTDAVNVAQLKEVAGMVGSGGSFSPITVSDGGSGSFTVGSAGSLKMVGSNANLSTNANGDTVTFALADNLNLTSVTADKVSVGSLTVNKDGKISGVAAGAAEKDAVNFGQLNALQKTVDNLQDTVNNLPTASGSGNATPLTVAAGDDNVQVAMNANKTRATVSLKDEISLNKITTGSASLSANGLNNGGNVISNVKAGSADLEAVNVKQLKDANAANLKASVQAVKGDNKNITTKAGDKEVQVALNNDISLNSVTAADKITVGSLTVNKNGKITGVVSDINDDDSAAVNVGLLKEELKKGGNYRPITVAGDTGSFEVDNGGQANWVGDGQNITTAADGDTVKIELNKNIEVDSVTAGSTVVNNNGVKVGNNGVALTQNGLNNGGQVISNVAPGAKPTDAVNVAQLNNSVYASEARMTNRIDSVSKHANAGTAQALAAANMPTASQPGEGMLALSGGVYRGEQGYAIGYSQLSENGRWVIRATGSGNSRNHFGGAVGVGFKLF